VNGQSNIWGNGVTLPLTDTNAAGRRFYRVNVQVPQ
jgi:hypothetical protein